MERLKEQRKQKNLKQKDLALLLGISVNTYSRYERGVRNPDLDTLKKISKILDISTDYLLGNTDIPLTLNEVNFNNDVDTFNTLDLFKNYDLRIDGEKINKEAAVKLLELLKLLK